MVVAMADERGSLEDLETYVEGFTKTSYSPEIYVDPTKNLANNLSIYLKGVYDNTRSLEHAYDYSKCNCPVKELLVSGFDLEQVWQQIQLQNDPIIKHMKKSLKYIKHIKKFSLHEVKENEELSDEFEEDSFETSDKEISDENDIPSNEEGDEKVDNYNDEDLSDDADFSDDADLSDDISDDEIKNKTDNGRKSMIDDNFFKMSEMEKYLEGEDKKEQRKLDGLDDESDEDELDLFGVVGSNGEESESEEPADPRYMKYKEYFDPPPSKGKDKSKQRNQKKTVQKPKEIENIIPEEPEGDPEEDQEDEDDEEKVLSKHEHEQAEMKKKIDRLEKANASDKPWQLKGEASATQRPVNSLLEEYVTFDHTSVGAPTITEETTACLEDLIKQRIKDEAWDDVTRKVKPNPEEDSKFKKRVVLDQTKSQVGLAEIYEREYIKQTEKDKNEKENEEHKAIESMMKRFFVKLDALSNFHFTPKPAKPELTIVSNVPSLQVEEVIPDSVTNAMRLAPEEIHTKPITEEKGDSEKTQTDKNRERRNKKESTRKTEAEKKRKRKLAEIVSGKPAKQSKKRALETLGKSNKNVIVKATEGKTDNSLTSSSAFFTRLQEDVKDKLTKKKLEMKGKTFEKSANKPATMKL